jgi:predicted kinase
MLVVISGLPATGKSAVAEVVARRTGSAHVSIDTIEDALLGAGMAPGWTTGVAAYEVARAVSEQNLVLGHRVVVDAVNDSEAARSTWRSAAAATASPLVFVLLTPPDPAEHRRRLVERRRGFRHFPEPSWESVRARADSFEAWPDEPVLVDSAQPRDAVVAQVLAALRDRG